MAISKRNAKTLAVSYAAFCRADTDESQGVWAGFLLEAMAKTGVQFGSKPDEYTDLLRHFVERGKKARDARIAKEAQGAADIVDAA